MKLLRNYHTLSFSYSQNIKNSNYNLNKQQGCIEAKEKKLCQHKNVNSEILKKRKKSWISSFNRSAIKRFLPNDFRTDVS